MFKRCILNGIFEKTAKETTSAYTQTMMKHFEKVTLDMGDVD